VRWGEFAEGGSARLAVPTSSRAEVMRAATALFEQVADRGRPIHRLTMTLSGVTPDFR